LSFATYLPETLATNAAPPSVAQSSQGARPACAGSWGAWGVRPSMCGNSQLRDNTGLLAFAAPAALAALAASGKRRHRYHRQRHIQHLGRRQAPEGVAVPLRRRADIEVKTPFFVPWVDWMCEHFMRELQLEEEPLPRDLAYKQGQSEVFAGRSVQTRIFVSRHPDSPVRYVRVTLVNNGQQFQAMNAAVYPAFSRGPLPMLAIDLLSFDNHNRQLYGIDWAPMSPTEEYSRQYIAPHIAEVRHGEHAQLTCQPTARFYGEDPEFFSPYLFFARPEGAEAMSPGGDLWDIFMEYCSRYSRMLQAAPRASSRDLALTALERQVAYEQWHYDHDPAPKLLNRVFGDDWTQEFMEQCMFPAKFKNRFYGHADNLAELNSAVSPS